MSGPRLEKADNGVWYVHWTEGRRSRRISTRTKDLRAAKAFLGTWLLIDGENREQDNGRNATVSDLWAAYSEKHVARTAAPATARFSWNNLQPFFGHLKLSEVTQAKVEDYEAHRARPHKGLRGSLPVVIDGAQPATVRRELATLMACFNWCADPKRRIISKADVPAFSLPDNGEPRDRWLRLPEVQKLLKAAAELRVGPRLSRGERFLWLALETAARKSAICELTWDRVDFETGVIHYDVPGRKKTKKRRSSVTISKALRPLLERAYAERATDFVLDNASEVWKIVHTIAEHAGVADVSPHVLRHTAATLMARRGVPLWTVSNILGNSLVMVEKVYAKHCPEAMAAAVEMISGGVLEAAE